jgi:hypothetical protein
LRRRLRALLERPIGDSERLAAFGLAALLVLAACGLLLLTRTREAPPATHPAAPAPTIRPALPAPTAPAAPRAPRPEPAADQPPPAVDHAARRFLAGYLRYLYGRGGASGIDGTSHALRRRLAAHPPRVSPATRHRRPRIVRITAARHGVRSWVLIASIDDGGVERYPLALELGRRHGKLLVTRLEGD